MPPLKTPCYWEICKMSLALVGVMRCRASNCKLIISGELTIAMNFTAPFKNTKTLKFKSHLHTYAF